MDQFKFNEHEVKDDFHYSTTLHPCCIEKLHSNKYCCGSYELDETTGHRNGQLDVFHNNHIVNSFSMNNGILDLKAMSNVDHATENSRIITAESSGSISIYELSSVALESVTSAKSEHGLTLSVDWCSYYPSHEDSVFVSSYQDSAISIHRLTPTGLVLECEEVNSHVMMSEPQPVWFVSFKTILYDSTDSFSNVFLSGGDDCVLRIWDLRTGSQLSSNCVQAVKNHHQAGVTCGNWHPGHEHVLVTGSYDEHVRIYDDRHWKKPLYDIHAGN